MLLLDVWIGCTCTCCCCCCGCCQFDQAHVITQLLLPTMPHRLPDEAWCAIFWFLQDGSAIHYGERCSWTLMRGLNMWGRRGDLMASSCWDRFLRHHDPGPRRRALRFWSYECGLWCWHEGEDAPPGMWLPARPPLPSPADAGPPGDFRNWPPPLPPGPPGDFCNRKMASIGVHDSWCQTGVHLRPPI